MSGSAVAQAPHDFDENELDLEDRARVLVTFRGVGATAARRRAALPVASPAPKYVFDQVSGMVYIRD